MTDDLDPPLTAIEHRLRRVSSPTTTPTLRRRVLLSIDDALSGNEPVQATTAARSGASPFPSLRDVVAGALFPSAVAAAVAIVAVSIATASRPAAALSLDARARIAGVSHQSLGSLMAEHGGGEPVTRPLPAKEALAHPGILRVLDGHHLLQETL